MNSKSDQKAKRCVAFLTKSYFATLRLSSSPMEPLPGSPCALSEILKFVERLPRQFQLPTE